MATVTIGGNTYPVLDTQANVLAYLSGSATPQASAWVAASADAQRQAMVEATRLLQRQVWIASVAEAIADADSENIPQLIKDAFAELAAYVASGDLAFLTASTTANTQRRLKAGSVEIENFFIAAATGTRFPLNVFELLKAYLAGQTGVSLTSASGTGRKSQFTKPYSIVEGL